MLIVDLTGIDITREFARQYGEMCIKDLVKLLATEGLVSKKETRKIRGKEKIVIWLNNVGSQSSKKAPS